MDRSTDHLDSPSRSGTSMDRSIDHLDSPSGTKVDRPSDRLVHYSLVTGDWPAAREATRQLVDSVASLRRHNASIPVGVLVFGPLPEAIRARIEALDARVIAAGSYEDHLATVCPRSMAEALALFPLLHKWTGLRHIAAEPASRVLYVDSDTVFLADVERLFEQCAEHDVYAREEPFSRASPLGYRPEHVDEDVLASIARRADSRPIAPFNCGVVLMNHGAHRRIAAAAPDFARFVYKLSRAFARRPETPSEGQDVAHLRARGDALPPEEGPALDVPIGSGWLKEQAGLWLTLGRIPGLRVAPMTRAQVLQGREYELFDLAEAGAAVIHYFSNNADHLRSFLSTGDHRLRSSGPPREERIASGTSLDVLSDFASLGERVERAYRAAGHDETRFAAIALACLAESGILERTSDTAVLEAVLGARALPRQDNLHIDFGQPPVVVFSAPGFYIEVLHWMDGTTNIHQHAFDGAFGVLSGSSLHSTYRFDEEARYGARLLRGRLSKTSAELLRRGDCRPIVSGGGFVHSLFHLDRPSVSVVVRTDRAPDAGPQYTYETPGLAHDPFFDTELGQRQRQAIRALAAIGHPGLPSLARDACAEADPLSFVRLAFEIAGLPGGLSLLPDVLGAARPRHGALVDAVLSAAKDRARRARILALRGKLRSADLRFFLALLLHAEDAAEMLDLVRARHPGEDGRDRLIDWLSEATGAPDPESPRGAVFEAPIDGPLADLARAMLGGAPFDAAIATLERDYDPADLRDRRRDMESIYGLLRASPLFAPMFRGPGGA